MISLLLGLASAGVDDPVHTGERADDDYAVVVGVERYAFLPDVPHAARDAAAVRTWLQSARGVPPERIELLTDASREQILAALERGSASTGPDGTLWVFWAGHGAASATTGERLLLGVDVMADPTVFEARALPVSVVEGHLAQAPQGVLWADTCYAGVGRDGQPLLQGSRFAVPSYADAAPSEVLHWAAAGPGELSQAHTPSRHGAFTWATLSAVQGGADGELDGVHDGAVTAAEAQAYVVRQLATEGLRGQSPQLHGDPSFVFARGLPQPAAAAVPLPAPVPVPAAASRPATPAADARLGRRRAAVLLGAGAGVALATAAGTRAAYRSAGPEAGSLDGLVVANQVAGWAGIAAGVGAIGLGVSTVLP